jgi:hypothetical protein
MESVRSVIYLTAATTAAATAPIVPSPIVKVFVHVQLRQLKVRVERAEVLQPELRGVELDRLAEGGLALAELVQVIVNHRQLHQRPAKATQEMGLWTCLEGLQKLIKHNTRTRSHREQQTHLSESW